MKKLRKYWFELLLVSPLVIFIIGFNFLPIIQTIIMGFRDRYTNEFTLATYRYLFNRPSFTESIYNTVFISLFSLVFQLLLGLGIALLLRKTFKGKRLVRSLILMPMGVPTLVSGVVAIHIFGNSGYLNSLLNTLFNAQQTQWLTGGLRTLIVITIADTWKVLPMMVLLLLAGLEAIPNSVYEAASMDGASSWQKLTKITLPMIKSSITMSILFRAVAVFRIFELPQVMVGRTLPFVATYAYEEYALGNNNASGAASTILMVLILIFTLLYMKFIDKGEGFGHD